MKVDLKTQQQAHVIAFDYGLIPVKGLKCERTIREGTTRTLFFCNTSHEVKILIKYNRDELEYP